MNTIEEWSQAAEMFALGQEQSEFAEVNKRVVMQRFADLRDKKVLDLGSGYGWYTDYFSRIGASVIGIDGASKMIELAQKRYPKLKFQQINILRHLPFESESFDMVFCNQVLMDVEDIVGMMQEVNRITKKNGIFYMSIVHPVFYDSCWIEDESGFKKSRIMERYLSEYSFYNQYWGPTKHYHRTLSWYINTIIEADFVLRRLEEPISYDGVKKSDEFPLFLFAEFKKGY